MFSRKEFNDIVDFSRGDRQTDAFAACGPQRAAFRRQARANPEDKVRS
jgi:hypothetical protein